MIHIWQHMTGPELAEQAGPDALAIVALGAVEQHGPHLPLSTDLDIVEGMLQHALSTLDTELPLFLLPAMALGASAEHGDYAGTLSLSAEQMSAQLASVGSAVAKLGIRRLVLVNGHGGNIAWMGHAALDLRRAHDLLVVKANYMNFAAPGHLIGAEELRLGLHGGQAETAMMMYLHPDRVRTNELDRFSSIADRLSPDALLGPEGEAAWAWMAQDLNPQGVVGDASAANAELGRQMLEFYGGKLAQVIREAANTQLPGWPTRSEGR
jgi:creatinine amidohydrolase